MGNKHPKPTEQPKKTEEPEKKAKETQKKHKEGNTEKKHKEENPEKTKMEEDHKKEPKTSNSEKKEHKKEKKTKKDRKEKSKKSKGRFLVSVLTGDAGTDATIKLRVTQFQGRYLPRKNNTWITLGHTWTDDWEEGQLDEFWFSSIPGIPSDYDKQGEENANNNNVSIEKNNNNDMHGSNFDQYEIEIWHTSDYHLPFQFGREGRTPGWYLNYVTIEDTQTGHKLSFPFYGFLSDEQVTISALSARLPQHVTSQYWLARRQEALEEARQRYLWADEFVFKWPISKKLPHEHNFSFDYRWTLEGVRAKGIANALGNVFLDRSNKLKTFKDFNGLYGKLDEYPLPELEKTWRKDEVFAYQRLQGPNPITIRRFSEKNSPKNFKFDKKKLSEICGTDFDEAVQTGNIYYCDYAVMQLAIDIQRNTEKGLCTPIALFHENKEKTLMPIGIQLYQESDTQIYYPTDGNAWLAAKIFVQSVDLQEHETVSHLPWTHLFMEGACVAMNRTMSTLHPIYNLMAGHFKYLLAINKLGLPTLVGPEGYFAIATSVGAAGGEALMKEAYEMFNFRRANPRCEFQDRDMMDLAYYPARDDGLLIYGIIEDFVTEIVNYYYPSTKEVEEDWELQAFINELAFSVGKARGLPVQKRQNTSNDKTKDLEWEISDPKDLIFVFASLAWTASGQHGTLNMPQYDFFGFVPASPGLLRKIPEPSDPKMAADITESQVVKMIMGKEPSLGQLAGTRLLSRNGVDSLGANRNYVFFEKETRIAQQRFREALVQAEEKINGINKTRPMAYTYLLPSNIPNSISI